MGADWYSFTSTALGRGILVAVKDVLNHLKKQQKISVDGDHDTEEAMTLTSVELALEEDVRKTDPVVPADWTVLAINQRFLLLSPFGDETKLVEEGFEVPGPYVGRQGAKVSVAPFSASSQQCSTLLFGKMIAVARAITGNFDGPLVFAPGNCVLSTTMGDEKIETLREPSAEEGVASDLLFGGNNLLFNQIPRDVTLKNKLTNETMASNRAILTFYGLNEKLLSKPLSSEVTDSETQELFLVETEDLELGRLEGWVKEFGATDISKNADCVFLVGGSDEDDNNKIAVNRSVLAMHNDILCRMLYGTERMPLKAELSSQPIRLPDHFDVDAVKLVFQGLMLRHCGIREVPHGQEEAVCAFLDYIDVHRLTSGLGFDFPSTNSWSTSDAARQHWYRDEDDSDDEWKINEDKEEVKLWESEDDLDIEVFEAEEFMGEGESFDLDDDAGQDSNPNSKAEQDANAMDED